MEPKYQLPVTWKLQQIFSFDCGHQFHLSYLDNSSYIYSHYPTSRLMACNSSESAAGDYNRRVAAEGNNSSVRQQTARRRAALDVYSWASIYGAPETGDDYKRVLPRAALRYPGGGNGVQSDVTTERAESGFFLFLMVVALQDLSRTNTQEKLPPLSLLFPSGSILARCSANCGKVVVLVVLSLQNLRPDHFPSAPYFYAAELFWISAQTWRR